MHLFVSFVVSVIFAKKILRFKNDNKNRSQITQKNIKYILLAGALAGIIGATLGIGGAIILIPFWLNC